MQGYLFKLPLSFVRLFQLNPTGASVRGKAEPIGTAELGDEYRTADEFSAVEERDPFLIDPTLVERAIRGHAVTQNRLANHLKSTGIDPRSPKSNEPNFDIAWEVAGRVFVAEVKSVTEKNEEKQLRLGLGQILRYADQLRHGGTVVPVLVAERRPKDCSWEQLCDRVGVLLVWPDVFAERL
jgi:hypothetical protein